MKKTNYDHIFFDEETENFFIILSEILSLRFIDKNKDNTKRQIITDKIHFILQTDDDGQYFKTLLEAQLYTLDILEERAINEIYSRFDSNKKFAEIDDVFSKYDTKRIQAEIADTLSEDDENDN